MGSTLLLVEYGCSQKPTEKPSENCRAGKQPQRRTPVTGLWVECQFVALGMPTYH